MSDLQIDRLFRDRRFNAVVSWLLVVILILVAVASVLSGDPLHGIVAGTVGVLALVPVFAYRTVYVTLPWEVVAMGALPILGRLVASVQLTSTLATYLSVAAVALIIAVELHVFTEVKMTYGFAILFVVVSTMAAAGVWAVVRWLWDLQFGTALIESEKAVMWEFVFSTVAGLLAGVIFELYFRRRSSVQQRLPSELLEEARP